MDHLDEEAPRPEAGGRPRVGPPAGEGDPPRPDADPADMPQDGALPWPGGLVRSGVRQWREFDAWANRLLPPGRGASALLAPAGYPWFFPLIAALAMAGMAFGPTLRLGRGQILLAAVGFAGLLAAHLAETGRPLAWLRRRTGARAEAGAGHPLLSGAALCAGPAAIAIAALAGPRPWAAAVAGTLLLGAILFGGAGLAWNYLLALAFVAALLVGWTEAETVTAAGTAPGLVLHMGAAMVLAMMAGLLAARLIVRLMIGAGDAGALAGALTRVDLFAPRDRFDTAHKGWIPAILIVPLRYPAQVLLPGAWAALLLPEALQWLWWLPSLAAWGLLVLGLVYERFMEVLDTLGRLPFSWPQLAVTWAIILIAGLKIAGVHFITYLLGGTNWTLFLYAFFAMVIAWFYGFWCDTFLARRLFPVLGGGAAGTTLRHDLAPAPAAPRRALAPLSNMAAGERTLDLHGAGRFRAGGRYAGDGRALRFFTPAQLLARMCAQIEAQPRPEGDAPDPLPLLRDLQRSAVVYPALTAFVAFGVLAVPGVWLLRHSTQPPELLLAPTAGRQGQAPRLDFAGLLAGREQPGSACPNPAPAGAPRIVVAASGGGTRAALYTAAVLRGLADQGQICNVVAVSGVSGGSAALAYFAAHQAELRRPGTTDADWQPLFDAVSEPFIQIVIDRFADLRLAYGRYHWMNHACEEPRRDPGAVREWLHPARSRPGSVLAEAMACRFGPAPMGAVPFGLILNTTLLGRFDTGEQTCTAGEGLPLAERARHCRDAIDGSGAGGRLALTNLGPLGSGTAADLPWLTTISDPAIPIARAAALSGNFPPVFSDAAIDVTGDGVTGQRYWVTDGGALENRGTLTLGLALRDALRDANAVLSGPLHVIIADASGTPDPYSESFGLRSLEGAGARLGLAMEGEILPEIRRLARKKGQSAEIHELPMPRVIRDAFGTHWRLPPALVVPAGAAAPQGAAGQGQGQGRSQGAQGPSLTLVGADVPRLVGCLFATRTPAFDDRATAAAILARSEADPAMPPRDSWNALIARLADLPPAGACGGLAAGPP